MENNAIVEDANGELFAVAFRDMAAAQEWSDKHDKKVGVYGIYRQRSARDVLAAGQ